MFGMNLGNLVVHLRANATQFHATLSAASAHMTRAGAKIQSAGRKMMLKLTAPLAIIGGMGIKTFASFDDAMTKSVAIMSGVTVQIRKEMEDQARSISRTGVTSLKDLASSYFYLASAGMGAKQSISALPVVEKFAVAGAFDMATATDLLTDAQSALGLSSKDVEKNMLGMLRVSDILVRANTLANASVQQFSEALTNTAAAAIKQYNMDLEEGVAILAVYADQGLKGMAAGSMMGRMTRLLIKAINDNGGAFRRLNIDVSEFAKTGKNITGIIEGITQATEGMGPAQKAATLEALGFQARVQQAILPLLGATDKIRGYQKALEKAGGYTERVAGKQLQSYSARMKKFKNNVVLAAESLGRALGPSLMAVTRKIQVITDWYQGLNRTAQKWIAIVMIAVAVTGPLVWLLGGLAKGIVLVVKGLKALTIASFTWLIPAAAIVVAIWAIVDAFTAADLGIWKWFRSMETVTGEKIGTAWDRILLRISHTLHEIGLRMRVWWEELKANAIDAGHSIYETMERTWHKIERGFHWMKEKIVSGMSWLAKKIRVAAEFYGIIDKKQEQAGNKILDQWAKGAKAADKESASAYKTAMAAIETEKKQRRMEYQENVRQIMERDEAWRKSWDKEYGDIKHQAFLEKLPGALKERTAEYGVGGGDAKSLIERWITPMKAAMEKQMKDVTSAQGGSLSKLLADQKAAMAKFLAEQGGDIGGIGKALDTEMKGPGADFRQLSLRRFGQDSPITSPGKKQQVHDEGVADKLSDILQVLQTKPTVATLG